MAQQHPSESIRPRATMEARLSSAQPLSTAISRQSSNQFFKMAVVIWLTLSISSVVLAAITWLQLSDKLAKARDTVKIQTAVDHILTALVDCETGQRGFTITGQESFLNPFVEGKVVLPGEFGRLVELARQDPPLLDKVIALRAQTELILNRLEYIVVTRKADGFDAAQAIIATGAGKVMMDKVRGQVAIIRAQRSDLISEDGIVARGQLLRASLTSLVAGILGVGAGLFAFWLSRLTVKHKERERELMEAKLQAERNSQQKTAFLANMSHEIRTPLNAILGFSDMLMEELKDSRHHHFIQTIRTSGQTLLQLINDVLDMSKMEAGMMQLRAEPTDPREICNFIHALFSEQAARKGVKLECKVQDNLPHALLLDKIRLRQILTNLVGNAVKFTERGNIYIRVQAEKQETSSHITLVLEVQDTGVGIPQDKLEAIFKPFVQAGAHHDKEQDGTGLGLSIVKRLTELMGGEVTAVSVPGQGSAFSLRFSNVPISARLAVSEKMESGKEADFNNLSPATFLVVDDNQTNRKLIEQIFKDTHHRVIFGTNGFEAVSKATQFHPDIILLDIRMPEMTGSEALEKIRQISGLELTPIIAVTASSLLAEETDLKQRFSGYVRKPFTKAELFREVAQFLPGVAALQKKINDPSVPGDTAFSQTVPALPELLSALRTLMATDWPSIRDSLAINETKAFAQRLESLGQQWQYQSLMIYARVLLSHAQNYVVPEMEKQLQEFPTLIDKLEKATTQ